MTVYTTLPTDDLNLAVEVTEAADLVELNITPAIVYAAGAGVISVNGAQGVVTLDTDDIPEGTTNLYSDQPNSTTDDVTFNSVTADMFGVQHFVAKARETITAGQPVYISGHSGNTPEVMVADFDDPTKMPAFGIASADIANNNNGSISTYGDLKNVDTTGTAEGETWAVGDELFVNGSKLTNVRPTLSTEEVQKIAKIVRVHASTGQMFLMGAGRSNDTPNLAHYNVFIGNAGGVEQRQLDYTTDILNTPTIPTNNNQLTNGAGYTTNTGTVTPSSTDTFTNKSGAISQWTNDAGYSTTTGTVTPSSTDTFTNKSGSNSQWTNDEGYLTSVPAQSFSSLTGKPTTIGGYGITDAFDGAYGSLTGTPTIPTNNNQLTNGAGYTTNTGTVTPTSTDTFTNKSGSNSQWTNDEAYLKANALTPYYTSTQVDALPVSTFTNDAGYITSETDNQTLSFADPVLTISGSLSTVDLSALNTTTLAWSAITSTPTTLSGYGITDGYDNADVDAHLNINISSNNEVLTRRNNDWDWTTLGDVATSNDYNDLDNLPTINNTTINNNADNRIITGSGTADTLNGESDFTWDGSNGLISGSAAGLTTPVMQFKTDNTAWNTGQMMLTDVNDDVCTLVGSNRNGFYEYNFTLDPNNTHGRTGVSTSAGDYFIAFRKDYSDPADVGMNMTVFGAHKGFDITVRDDGNNYGGNQYKGRPLNLNALETNFNCGIDRDVLALTVQEEAIDCKIPIGQARLSSDPANPAGGWTYYNTTTNKLRLYVDLTGWVDLN
jgi:hypothetical protein